MRLIVPGFRFVEKLHACRLPWIRQLKIRDENDETFMIADFPGHRSCLIAFIHIATVNGKAADFGTEISGHITTFVAGHGFEPWTSGAKPPWIYPDYWALVD